MRISLKSAFEKNLITKLGIDITIFLITCGLFAGFMNKHNIALYDIVSCILIITVFVIVTKFFAHKWLISKLNKSFRKHCCKRRK